MSNILIYTKDGCHFCTLAKNLLSEKGLTYNESKVGQEILREDFMATFPETKTLPLIIINGVKIGGYNELREHLNNDNKTFLAE